MILKTTPKTRDFSKIPQTSGVYFFYGPPPFGDKSSISEREAQSPKGGGELLYIGKAVNLRSRIKSHFAGDIFSPAQPRRGESRRAKSEMIKAVKKIRWQLTNSGVEALIAEAMLIKKHRPFYNVALRDDKSYSFVEMTKENFPRIYVTHETFKKPGNTYIGPFTVIGTLKTVLSHLRRVFPYCTCKKPHKRVCINAELGKCPGFCCDKSKLQNPNYKFQTEYRRNIKNIIGILTGKKQALLKKLGKEMIQASREHDYELAALVRDRISGLEKIFSHRDVLTVENKEELETRPHTKFGVGARQEVLVKIRTLMNLPQAPQKIEIYDISNIQGKFAVGAMAVFKQGWPDKNSYRKFRIRFKNEPDDTGMIKEILARRLTYEEWPLPDLFVIDGGRGQLSAALEIIRGQGLKTPVTALAKRKEELHAEERKAPLELKTANQKILHLFQSMRDEAHRFAVNYHKKLRKKTVID